MTTVRVWCYKCKKWLNFHNVVRNEMTMVTRFTVSCHGETETLILEDQTLANHGGPDTTLTGVAFCPNPQSHNQKLIAGTPASEAITTDTTSNSDADA